MTPSEVAELLDSSGHAFAATLDAVTPELASWRPAPDEWSVNEVVGHVIEAEKNGFAGRIKIILGADEPDLPTWDRDRIIKDRDDCARDPSSSWSCQGGIATRSRL